VKPRRHFPCNPFEHAVGIDQQTALSFGRAFDGLSTALAHDWNMLQIVGSFKQRT